MEFNLNLSTTAVDIVNYFQGNNSNMLGQTEHGIFNKALDGLFGESDESEDIDYNLIMSLLNNLKLFNTQENSQNTDEAYVELDKVDGLYNTYNKINENELDFNIEVNNYDVNTNLLSSEELEILNNLKNNFENEYMILDKKTTKIELSDKEIEVLKKLDDVISKNKIDENKESFQTNKFDNLKLEKVENKFNQLETRNTTDKLNLIRNDELDKDLDALENILNGDNEGNFILNNNQLTNKDINSINTTSMKEVSTIRHEYIGEDIVKTVKYLKSNGQEEITIKISPRELGDMTIRLINNQDETSVAIIISKADVFNLVNDNQSEIAKHLKELNINVKDISVEIKGDTQNNFSSNLSQGFGRNNKGSKQESKKTVSSRDEQIEDIEEVNMEQNVNILV